MKIGKKKWIVGIVIIIVMVAVILAIAVSFLWNSAKSDKATDYTDDSITRYEWIKMLGDYTGAVEYSNETPYFSDVTIDSEYFLYVQSAVEWGYVSDGDLFCGDEVGSGKFIALSAMRSVGDSKLQIYLGTDKKLTDKDYLEIAIENQLIDKSKLKS